MMEAWQNLPEHTICWVFNRIPIVLQLIVECVETTLMLRRGEDVMVQQLWLLLCWFEKKLREK
jgi:hypothetical protein